MRTSTMIGLAFFGLLCLQGGACFQPPDKDQGGGDTNEPLVEGIRLVKFFPDGKRALSVSVGIITWDLETGKAIRQFDKVFAGSCAAVSPDGKRILLGSTGDHLSLWDAEAGKNVFFDRLEQGWMTECAFSPDGRAAFTTGGSKSPTLWNAEKDGFKIMHILQEHGAGSAAFSSDGKYLVSKNSDKTIKLWEIPSGKCLKTFDGKMGYKVRFSPDGKKIIAVGTSVNVWEHTGKLLYEAEFPEKRAPYEVSQDGTLAVSSVKPERTADNKFRIPEGKDQNIRIWEVQTGKLRCTLEGVKIPFDERNRWDFSPDGKRIMSFRETTFFIWSTETGKLMRSFEARKKVHW